MPIEYKEAPQFTKAIDDRIVTGIFMVHGHIDDGFDRSHPGALADYKVDGRDRARFLWAHDAKQPPVAAIKSIRELTRAELPPAVLSYAPDATGAAEVVREYLDTPRGSEVLAGIRAGAIQEMSYAYEVSKWATTEEDSGPVRELYGLKLFDISDVNHGMNNSTLSAKRLLLADHSDAVLAAVKEYTDRLSDLHSLRAKEGRVLSGENRKRIESAVEALAGASDALKNLLEATEPQKNSGHADTNRLRIMRIEREQRLRQLGVPLL